MSLETVDRHNEAIFEFLWCPVCGHDVFSHLRFEGVFCEECNTQVRLREPRDRYGYEESVVARFDTDTTWNLHYDEMLRRDLPDGTASALVVGSPGDYQVRQWTPSPGEDWKPVERGEFDDVEEPPEVSHLA